LFNNNLVLNYSILQFNTGISCNTSVSFVNKILKHYTQKTKIFLPSILSSIPHHTLTRIELEVFHEPLAQVAATPLGEDGALGLEGHAPLKTLLWASILKEKSNQVGII
jgi:hypothetical protein